MKLFKPFSPAIPVYFLIRGRFVFTPNCHESLCFALDRENPHPFPLPLGEGEGEGIFLS